MRRSNLKYITWYSLICGAIFCILNIRSVRAQDVKLVDSLKNQIKRHDALKLELGRNVSNLFDTSKANILNALCNAYIDYDNTIARDYAEQMLLISERMYYDLGMAKAYNSLGIIMQNENKFSIALDYHRKSLNIKVQLNDQNGIAGSYNNIGNIYLSQDNYPEALKYYFKALRINEQTGNKEWQAYNLCNISDIYGKQGKYPEALTKLLESGKLVDTSGNMFLFPVYFFSLGVIYEEQKNSEEAMSNYYKYADACKNVAFDEGQAIAFNHIGNLYSEQGNTEKALQLFFTAMNLFAKNGSDQEIAETYLNIGNTYAVQKKFSEAKKYLDHAMLYARKLNSTGLYEKTYESFSELAKATGNYASALEFTKLAVIYRDSILNTENTRKSLGLQLQFDTEKKEQQIALLTKNTQLQQIELVKQTTNRNVFLLAALLAAFLAFITYNRFRIKKKANTEIERTMNHLKTTQEQLVESEKLAALGKLTADVAKEMKKPVHEINVISQTNRMLLQKLRQTSVDGEHLKFNLFQIYRYGKDADAIVKKVLTQSRKVGA